MGAAARFLQKKTRQNKSHDWISNNYRENNKYNFARTMGPRYFLSTKIAISQQVFE
jgi:hypothetical protein